MGIYIVGLTGGMGCGKSTVAKCLKTLDIPISDADNIAKKVMENEETLKLLREVFDKDIFCENGKINNKKLSEVLFSNNKKRKALNKIVHPKVWQYMYKEAKMYENQDEKVIFFDVPLLIESGWNKLVNEVWVVKTNYDLRIKRLKKRTNLSKESIEKRILCQMPETEKEKFADVIINNNYTFEETKKQVIKELSKMFERIEKR